MTSEKHIIHNDIYEIGNNKKVGQIFFAEEIDKDSGKVIYKFHSLRMLITDKIKKESIAYIKSNTYKNLLMKVNSILFPYKLYIL